MRVAVCCPGPSLPARWPGRADYDLVWAVNRALITVPEADWLSAGDAILYTSLLPLECRPRIGAVTTDGTIEEISGAPSWAGIIWVGWGSIPRIHAHKAHGRPLSWSMQVALCHAGQLKAKHIDLYGADGAAGGTPIDCTGYAGEDRTPERWRREELDLALTIELLAADGIVINRISP